MLQNTYKKKKQTNAPKRKWYIPHINPKLFLALGIVLQGLTVFFAIAFLSHLVHGPADQAGVEAMAALGWKAAGQEVHNWLGLLGAWSAYYFMFRWFGITAFLLLPPLYLLGHRLTYGAPKMPYSLCKAFVGATFGILWISLALGYLDVLDPTAERFNHVLGGVGFELGELSHSLLGWGTLLFLAVTLLLFLLFFFSLTSFRPTFLDRISWKRLWPFRKPRFRTTPKTAEEVPGPTTPATPMISEGIDPPVEGMLELAVTPASDPSLVKSEEPDEPMAMPTSQEPDFSIESHQPVEHFADHAENYDPTLDLSSYQYPAVDLLAPQESSRPAVSQAELTQNKDRIVETLTNFKIGVASIKATIGPTVTLYEIVPAAGVKISRIKNLEDDIALSLAALGIRIIAPIPGKGTIGIEVPNKQREMVPLRVMLATDKFMKSDMELPLVVGKTIANEVFMADLARMPHLLIAGATGQGKSVGLNVVLTSLIYKKHPSQLKLVLVDPKKVELSLYNKLERHFLAKLPSNEEAIITETEKVIHTLNSLCLEMEHRYELLKEAGVRNIKEYNTKFVKRRLNPEQGHRFLPYIVLVIDEFADMMMTAGKEVETPIARLAQLARAIGIHLVLATQRPSVNVITGIIKANFPVRISYKVTSRIDSRTILDTGGAEQLVGQGDMLLSMNSEVTRLQCPFLDTEEVERVCEYIGAQRAYASAYLLPAYEEGDKEKENIDLSERDAMFDEAAHLVVNHQQGSTSLIQRKLKLGYNRAGRLIDQLEAAGVVGPFEGSKAREVLIPDVYSLEQLLASLDKPQPLQS